MKRVSMSIHLSFIKMNDYVARNFCPSATLAARSA